MDDREVRVYLLLLPVAAWMLYEIRETYFAMKSQKWPTTKGKIRTAYLEAKQEGSEGNWFKPNVEYEYFVDGTKVVSKKFWFGFPLTWDYGAISWSLVGLRKGSEVNVLDDPKNRKRSVLVPGVQPMTKLVISLQTLYVLMFIYPLIRSV